MLLRRPRGHLFLPALLLVTAVVSKALSPDGRLLQLVPPGSQVIAGVRAPSQHDMKNTFILITHRNLMDFEDFMSLTGGDSSRTLREVIFVSFADHEILSEHSFLVSGTFNQNSIFRFADGVKVRRHSYLGIPVLVVQPFERERSFFDDVRWLAIPEPNLAVFGTIASVRLELDRYLKKSPVDANLVEGLTRLSRKDDTWSLVAAPMPAEKIYPAFGLLDPELGGLVRGGESILFGIHRDNHVTLDYEIIRSVKSSSSDNAAPASSSSGGLSFIDSSSVRPDNNGAEGGRAIHGVVKVSRHRYEEWLKGVYGLVHKGTAAVF